MVNDNPFTTRTSLKTTSKVVTPFDLTKSKIFYYVKVLKIDENFKNKIYTILHSDI